MTTGRAPGVFVVSLDFEQYWGMRDHVALADCREDLLGAREAVPAILELFVEFGVRATWAVVGLLLAESRREMLDRLPSRLPRYRRRALSPYEAFADIGDNECEDPYHFALSLVRRIADTPGQEVGTHTFAHYYCLEEGATPADLRADLVAALAVTCDKLGCTPRSIVFPRNQFDRPSIGVCDEIGLAAYRGNPPGWAHRPRRVEDESYVRRAVRLLDTYASVIGPHGQRIGRPPGQRAVDVAASRFLRSYHPILHALEPIRLRRITGDMERAAREGLVFHLWSHPQDLGRHLGENLAFLRRILECWRTLRDEYGMVTLTMAEAGERASAWGVVPLAVADEARAAAVGAPPFRDALG